MSTPLLDEMTESIETLGTAISALRAERSEITSRLETMAHTWDTIYPVRHHPGQSSMRFRETLGCSRCYFVYHREQDGVVLFSTNCTYCGPGAGAGLEIPATWFERALQDEKDDNDTEEKR